MSAPDSSNSKAPPSLLSDKAKAADGNSSRILANLEGRVAPPAEKPRRSASSRLPLVLLALLVIGAGGWGAWHMQQRVQNGSTEVAGSPTPAVAGANAGASADKHATVAAAPASGTSGAAALTAKADAPAAASSQAATIVSDDSDKDKPVAPGSASASGDDNRLSRALADGAEPSNASAPLAAAAGASATAVPAVKNEKDGKLAVAPAGHPKHDAASTKGKHETAVAANHHASAPTVVAQAKKPHPVAKNSSTPKEDSDADLLAALVARTKPADVKPAAGAAGGASTKVSTSASAKLAERVKECSQRGFFEDQLCRWRVCDGHWGKDPACPGSAQQARQP